MPVVSFDDGRLGFEVNFCGTREEFAEKHPTIARWLGGFEPFTRSERKAIQTVIHMARTDNRITDERCTELCALVDRETHESAPAAAVPPVDETPVEKQGELDGFWISGRHLDEEFSIGDEYSDRESAIADAAEYHGFGVGDTFQTGRLRYVRQEPDCPVDADGLIDQAVDGLSSDWHESAIEHWTDKASDKAVAEELEENLTAVWDAWIKKHELFVDGYQCDDVETDTVTQEMIDKIEAAEAAEEAKET